MSNSRYPRYNYTPQMSSSSGTSAPNVTIPIGSSSFAAPVSSSPCSSIYSKECFSSNCPPCDPCSPNPGVLIFGSRWSTANLVQRYKRNNVCFPVSLAHHGLNRINQIGVDALNFLHLYRFSIKQFFRHEYVRIFRNTSGFNDESVIDVPLSSSSSTLNSTESSQGVIKSKFLSTGLAGDAIYSYAMSPQPWFPKGSRATSTWQSGIQRLWKTNTIQSDVTSDSTLGYLNQLYTKFQSSFGLNTSLIELVGDFILTYTYYQSVTSNNSTVNATVTPQRQLWKPTYEDNLQWIPSNGGNYVENVESMTINPSMLSPDLSDVTLHLGCGKEITLPHVKIIWAQTLWEYIKDWTIGTCHRKSPEFVNVPPDCSFSIPILRNNGSAGINFPSIPNPDSLYGVAGSLLRNKNSNKAEWDVSTFFSDYLIDQSGSVVPAPTPDHIWLHVHARNFIAQRTLSWSLVEKMFILKLASDEQECAITQAFVEIVNIIHTIVTGVPLDPALLEILREYKPHLNDLNIPDITFTTTSNIPIYQEAVIGGTNDLYPQSNQPYPSPNFINSI